ncbi:hypothetical protein MHH28_07690 [Paenibacillus sp. FSL K6-1217]|uniref:hypothetical protein n=1 Tax=Paenibacillus sp. FSL K6-1217 TaxID=2921466 RepID=UPI00324B0CAA
MKTSRLPMNLQLFASNSAEVDGETFEIEEDVAELDYEVDESGITIPDEEEKKEESSEEHIDADESDAEDEGAEHEDPKPDGKGKNTTGNAVIAERRKWQERLKAAEKKGSLADKLLQATGAQSLEQLEQQLDGLKVRQYEDQGYDSQTAMMLVDMQRKQETLNQQLRKQQFDNEVQSLKSDPFYGDIEDWRDELEPIAARTGQTLQAAYMALRGRERMEEYKREIEQRAMAERSKKRSAKVDTSAGGGSGVKKSNRVQLSADELAVAKMAGMSPEDYYKHKKK